MSLLNYTYHAAPTSHKDVLSKFRTFAIAQGWNSDAYETSKDWLGPSPYSWKAGTSDFLQLSSNGYGTQDIIVRFHFEGTVADALSEYCYFHGTKPGFGTPVNTLATIPVLQNAYTVYQNFSKCGLPSGSHIGCWFFGNDKILIVVDQVTTTFAILWWCGSIEMFDPSQDCFVCWTSDVSNSTPKYYNAVAEQAQWNSPWYDVPALISGSGSYWWNGAGKSYTEINISSGFTVGDTISISAAGFTKLGYVVHANAFSGKRVLIKPTVFGLKSSLWYPIGTMPLYNIVYSGLTFGEQINYGSETYICFPNCFHTRKYGTAFRIA